MNNQNSHSILANVKEELIQKIIEAYLSVEAPTRISVAERSGISATTVGKVFSALSDIGLAHEKRSTDKGTRANCLLSSLDEKIIFAVIDLSSSIFTLSYFSGNNHCLLCLCHEYDGEISLYDNIKTLLSQASKSSRTLRRNSSSASVILADDRLSSSEFGGLSASLFLPTDRDRETIIRLIQDVYGSMTVDFFKSSDAFTYALRYQALGDRIKKSCAYIRFGRPTSVILQNESGTQILRPSRLFNNKCFPLGDFGQELIATADQTEHILRTINLITCVAEPDSYVIETNGFRYNCDMAQIVTRAFAIISSPLPQIIARQSTPSILSFGAAGATAQKFLCSCLLNAKVTQQ